MDSFWLVGKTLKSAFLLPRSMHRHIKIMHEHIKYHYPVLLNLLNVWKATTITSTCFFTFTFNFPTVHIEIKAADKSR